MAPQTQHWPEDRAILFVHGVGNATNGDYAPLVAQVEELLGDQAKQFALYFLYYDQVNDWFANKEQAGLAFQRLVSAIRSQSAVTDVSLGNAIAEFAGDVLWPILIADARTAVRETYLNQLRQIIRDGERAGTPVQFQHLSIIAHSMGCFHTYEALCEAAADVGQGLSPARWGVQFDNVIYMASPVQIIRTIAGAISVGVPLQQSLHCLSGPRLDAPFENNISGKRIESVRRTVSVTGNLDPVGGHFFRAKPEWAYMDLPGQLPIIDQQKIATTNGSEELTLANVLQTAVRDHQAPTITPQNPHDWSAYIARHADDLRSWLTE